MFAENFRKNFTKIGHFVYYRNTQYEICETETIRNFFETSFALTTNTPTAAAQKKGTKTDLCGYNLGAPPAPY